MKISEKTISALGKVITGDGGLSQYRTGPVLVAFFRDFGSNDIYGQGFPSRWKYAEDKLRELNGTEEMAKVFSAVLDPRNFIEVPDRPPQIVAFLNKYLTYDGYELVLKGRECKVTFLHDALVETETIAAIDHNFIHAQLGKCEDKFKNGDYDGAITNARTLVEAVLMEIEEKLSGERPTYDGDMIRLYKRVQKLLHLDPTRKDVEDVQKQVLSGLSSVVSGISGLRNKMGDAHATGFDPSKYHAKLAINSANTLAEFLFDVYEAQPRGNK